MAIQEWAAKSIKAAMNKGQQALSGGKDLIGKAVGDTLDMGKQAYNQISFQPEVQPTQDQITADFMQKLREGSGAALERGGQLGGQAVGGLLDLAKNPETWQIAADLGALTNASANPELAAQLARISGSIGDRIEARGLLEQEALESQSDLKNKSITSLNNFIKQGFAVPKEGDDPNYITDVTLPNGEKIQLYNQKLALQDREQTYEESKYDKDYNPITEAANPMLVELGKDPLFATSGAVRDDTFNDVKLKAYVEKKGTKTNELLSSQEGAKRNNQLIKNIINDPKLDELIGTKNILGIFESDNRFLEGLLGSSETAQSLLADIDTLSSEKILGTLKDLKKSGGGSTGFGALNQEELRVISNAIASLHTAQSKESFVKNLIKIDKTFSNATNRVQNAYGKKYSTEGIEMYQSPYDVNYAEKFLSQQQTTPTTPTKPTLQQMISGTVPKQLTQRKVNEDEISDEEVKRVLGIK